MKLSDLSIESYLWYSQLWGWAVSTLGIAVMVIAGIAWRKWKASRSKISEQDLRFKMSCGHNWWKRELHRPTWARRN